MGRVCGIVRRRTISSVGVLLVCASLFGCQTTRSFSDGCPGVYSGVRYYSHQIDSMPWDGKIFFAVDLPFSAMLDTLLLPFTSFTDPERPPEGWVPGCAWSRE